MRPRLLPISLLLLSNAVPADAERIVLHGSDGMVKVPATAAGLARPPFDTTPNRLVAAFPDRGPGAEAGPAGRSLAPNPDARSLKMPDRTDTRWPAWPLAAALLLLGAGALAWQSRRCRRRIERELREHGAVEERERSERDVLLKVLDAIPSRVFWKDRDGRYLGCNAPGACEAGLDSAEAIVGLTDADLAWSDQAADFRRDDIEVMEKGTARIRQEDTAIIAGGSVIHWRGNKVPLRGADGAVTGLVWAYRDITEFKEAEDRLRLMASVFENSHEGIIITNDRGIIIDVNQAFIRLTGYNREEVVGNNPRLLKSGHHDADFYSAMWQFIKDTGHWRGEIWNRRKDGALYAELLDVSAVRSSDGTVSHYVGIFSDITVMKEHQRQLEQMAHYDPLTRLPNRVLLADRLEAALLDAAETGAMLAVAYLDLDGFKPVNDNLGHEAGDLLLVAVSERLKGCVKGIDTVARLGGDEFVILLSFLHSIEDCRRAMDRIIAVLCEPYRIRDQYLRISASIGVSLYPDDNADPDALLRHADQAMYLAKRAGRNRYQIFNPGHERRAQEQAELRSRIETALEGNEFVLRYQPRIDLRKHLVTGAEALLLWQHPERGLLPAAEFLPVVENTTLAAPLGRWVLLESLRQLEAWWEAGLHVRVGVNLFGRHLQDESFVEDVQAALAARPAVPPSALELEILESMATDAVAGTIAACREIGVRFVLDNFGTGCSSLSCLKRLPLDTLKIDRSLVGDMLIHGENHGIIGGIVALAHAFNHPVVAVGIESVEHAELLMELGCDHGQGYGIARPMPWEELPAWAAVFVESPFRDAVIQQACLTPRRASLA